MNFQSLISQAVRKLPTIGEPHFIKGVLALKHFSKRYPHWDDSIFQMAFERVKWATYPEAKTLFHTFIHSQGDQISPTTAKRLIGRGLFPLTYLCGYHWFQLEGLESIIQSYKERAIHELGYLGHGWSVWCSFYEVIGELEGEVDQLFALERFTEFVAKKFPGYPTNNPNWQPPLQDDPGQQDFSVVLSHSIEKPGFFGHHLLTLGYLYRHRHLLTEIEWNIGLNQVNQMTKTTYMDEQDNVHVSYQDIKIDTDDLVLENTIKNVLLYGIRDLHSLTLTDICYELWQVSKQKQKNHLIQYLRTLIVEN